MFQRIILLVVSVTAALMLAVGLALAGFGPAAPTADVQAVDAVADPAPPTAVAGPPSEAVQVDTVYLEPAPAPEVVVAKVVRTAPAGRHDDEGENEGEDD
jgi:hypothetical protein